MSLVADRLRRLAHSGYLWTVVLFGVSLSAGYLQLVPLRSAPKAAVQYPDTGTARERVLIYIGSSSCGPSNDKEIPTLVATVRDRVRETATRDGMRFVTVGIAKDGDVAAGLAHLAKIGQFDEIMTGRSWANIGVMKYVFSDLRGPAATPQVLVVDRSLYNQGVFIDVTQERVIVRRVGLQELRDWINGPGGAFMPPVGSASQ